MGTVANLINERGNQLFKTQLRSRRRLHSWSLLFLCEKGLNLLLSLSVFFILGRFLNYWHRFLRSPIAGMNFNRWHRFVLLWFIFSSHLRYVSLSFLFCNPISISAKKIKTLLFAVLNVNRWWGCHCLLPWFCLCMIWCLLPWFFCQYHYQVHSAVITVLCAYCIVLNLLMSIAFGSFKYD